MPLTIEEQLRLQILYIEKLQNTLSSREKMDAAIKGRQSLFIDGNFSSLSEALKITPISNFKAKPSMETVTYDAIRTRDESFEFIYITNSKSMTLREKLIFEAACFDANAEVDNSSSIQNIRTSTMDLSSEEGQKELDAIKQFMDSVTKLNATLPFALKDPNDGWEIKKELFDALEKTKQELIIILTEKQLENFSFRELNDDLINYLQSSSKNSKEQTQMANALINILSINPKESKQQFGIFLEELEKYRSAANAKKSFLSGFNLFSNVNILKNADQVWLDSIADKIQKSALAKSFIQNNSLKEDTGTTETLSKRSFSPSPAPSPPSSPGLQHKNNNTPSN